MEQFNAYFNHEAEISVLGAAMQDERCAKMVADLEPDDFHDVNNRAIHETIREMVGAKQKIDLVTIDAVLEGKKRLESIGGTRRLIEITQFVPTTANIRDYIGILRECSMRRKLYLIGKQLMERSGAVDQDANEVREWATTAVREVRIGNCDPVISQYDASMKTYEKLERTQHPEDEPDPNRIMSGIDTLDAKIGGIDGSKLVIIGARPSVGKSILALTFCVNAAKQGKRVLLVTLEMDEVEITERILANDADVPLNVITRGALEINHWMSLGASIGKVSQLPLWYCTEANTIDRIRRVAYHLYENGGLDMIAVDYIQLMEATFAKRQNRQEQVSEISRGLKRLAQELKIPVLALTQLNRQSEGTVKGVKVKRQPTMSEARESGAIEQDANIFMLLHDPSKDEMRNDEEKALWQDLKDKGLKMFRIIIDKNRQGKRGTLTVAFDGDHMRFLPIVRQQPPAEAEAPEEDLCQTTMPTV